LHFDKKILSQGCWEKQQIARRISRLSLFFPWREMSRVSQARSLGKYFLLVDNMLVVLGFFVVFPLISIALSIRWAGRR
jgi:DHA1 family multidrug resistance protein-like MFS transporter